METLVTAVGIVLLIWGIIKRKTSWGKRIILISIILLAVSLYLGWPDLVAGFRAGLHDR